MTQYVTPEDMERERSIAAVLGEALRCTVRPFPMYTAVDWYAERDGSLIAVLECKARTHRSDAFATTFLTVRKWLALTLAQAGLGVPGVFVVSFVDGIRWCRVGQVDASAVGFVKRDHYDTVRDFEPVIHVPVAQMRQIEGAPT